MRMLEAIMVSGNRQGIVRRKSWPVDEYLFWVFMGSRRHYFRRRRANTESRKVSNKDFKAKDWEVEQ